MADNNRVNYRKEISFIDRAIKSGEVAYKKLVKMQEELEVASRWGLLDTAKGNLFSSFMKQNKLKKAGAAHSDAVLALNAFERELANVSRRNKLKFHYKKPAVLADYFLQNRLVSIIIQMQIRKNKKTVEKTINQVLRIIAELRQEKHYLRTLERGENLGLGDRPYNNRTRRALERQRAKMAKKDLENEELAREEYEEELAIYDPDEEEFVEIELQ